MLISKGANFFLYIGPPLLGFDGGRRLGWTCAFSISLTSTSSESCNVGFLFILFGRFDRFGEMSIEFPSNVDPYSLVCSFDSSKRGKLNSFLFEIRAFFLGKVKNPFDITSTSSGSSLIEGIFLDLFAGKEKAIAYPALLDILASMKLPPPLDSNDRPLAIPSDPFISISGKLNP